jgi:hypothetical protein
VGVIVTGKEIGCMVRKTQNLKAPVNGVADIVLLPPGGMVAPPGVGVIIGNHNRFSSGLHYYIMIAK